jgi:hypothetical protein
LCRLSNDFDAHRQPAAGFSRRHAS